jgi:hypothetical protein
MSYSPTPSCLQQTQHGFFLPFFAARNQLYPDRRGSTSHQDLERELEKIEALFADLSIQRKDLLAEIDGYRALISPARRLPPDILREIFVHTLPTAHNALIDPNQSPMVLTYICSGWRGIALTTPYLSSTIHIPIPPIAYDWTYPRNVMCFSNLSEQSQAASVESLRKYATVVTNWLKKSSARPLSISLCDSDDSIVPREYYAILLNSLLQFSTRWKNVVFDIWSPHSEPLANLVDSEFPLLERLTMHGFHFINSPRRSWKESGLIRAPRLREISWTQFREAFVTFPINWGQLTVLKLTTSRYGWRHPANTSLSEVASILRKSPQLISCHFEIPLLDNVPGGDESQVLSDTVAYPPKLGAS